MNQILLLSGIVIVICILTNKITKRIEVPSLLAFIALGMCFGENGIFRIAFDNYQVAEVICSFSLIFIMFYGGFGSNVEAARPVAGKAVLLSTLGVALTAGLVGWFVHVALRLPWPESLLIGSVISSTDAASVFNILRTKKLDLKYNTASLLEIESGSNDPMSYMLTILMLSLMQGESMSVPLMLIKQIGVGLLCGLGIGWLAIQSLKQFDFDIDEGKTIFSVAVMFLSYAVPVAMGGNGYLSTYLCGILMGNAAIPAKRNLVGFFDAVTGIAQMLIFFLLGLLVTPIQLPLVIVPAFLIMVFMTFVARPAAVSAILLPFGSKLPQIGIVSWAGLRGAASIVFAITAVLSGVSMRYNLYNLVFCVVLLSIAIQGSLLPMLSIKMNMIDRNADVRKTFNDYQEESDISFVKTEIGPQHPFLNLQVKDICLPQEFLIVLIFREQKRIVPNGETYILAGDQLVMAAPEFSEGEQLTLRERHVEKGNKWIGKCLKEIKFPEGTLIVTVRRGKYTFIPEGSTVICENDILVTAKF